MKLLPLLKKNAVLIIFILAVLGLVLYMSYKPEGFQKNPVAPPPSSSSNSQNSTQYKPFPF
jgi:hypothetical protein